jgi:quercetin dioxygenase-like cupin family protein
MEQIAAALGVGLAEFFTAASGGEGGLVVRVTDRQSLVSGWSKADIETLTAPGYRAPLHAILIALHPGGRSGKHPYPDSRGEFAIVLRGKVVLTLGPEEHRLKAGDAATILPGESRLWRNDGAVPARVLIVSVPSMAREQAARRRASRART